MNTAMLSRVARLGRGEQPEPSDLKPEHSPVLLFGVTLVAIILTSVALMISTTVRAQAALENCSGVQVSPGDDLAQVAASNAAGTTYCVRDGDYSVRSNIVVQSNDHFRGLYSDSTRPTIRTTTAKIIFSAAGSYGATISHLTVSGAVGDPSCRPTCGRGIHGGTNLTLNNIRVTNNANQGVGGQGPNLLIKNNSELDNNGTEEFYLNATYASAAGVKSVNSFAVYDSYIHDNAWNGVWCDLECNAFEVHDSSLVRNGKSGIFYEVSSGPAVIEGNYFAGNGKIASPMYRQPAGLSVTSSQNLNAYGNTFAGNNLNYGFWAIEDSRSPDLKNLTFHDNTMNDDTLRGCTISGASCTNN
jgi:hypothetical protein